MVVKGFQIFLELEHSLHPKEEDLMKMANIFSNSWREGKLLSLKNQIKNLLNKEKDPEKPPKKDQQIELRASFPKSNVSDLNAKALKTNFFLLTHSQKKMRARNYLIKKKPKINQPSKNCLLC